MKKFLFFFAAIIFFSVLPLVSFSQCSTTVTNTSSQNWTNSGTWNSGVPISTSDVCWNNSKTVYFPVQSSGGGSSIQIASMTMAQNDNLTIGDGDGFTDQMEILGSLDNSVDNSVTITIKSDGILKIDVDFLVKNGLTLIVESGGVLTVGGTVTINDASTLNLSGDVTIAGDFNIGNSGSVTINSGSTLTVGGDVNAGTSTCVTNNGTVNIGGTCSGGSSNCSSSSSGGSGIGFCSALPITLNSFSAEVINETVNLKWSTSSEINFDHFLLERSSNGKKFTELTKIKGSGFSNTRKNYSFTDTNPLIGNSYYRLTSIDFDGYTEVFSKSVVRVTVNAGKNFFIVPNPIEGNKLKGGVNFDTSNSQVLIYDRMGIIVDRYTLSGTEFEMLLPNLPNGVYFAQLQSGEYTKSVRFVVNQ